MTDIESRLGEVYRKAVSEFWTDVGLEAARLIRQGHVPGHNVINTAQASVVKLRQERAAATYDPSVVSINRPTHG